MKSKNIILSVVIVLVLLAGALFATKKEAPVVNSNGTVVERGALTGPDIPFQYLSVGGFRKEYRQRVMVPATTTPCSVQAPSSTSTLAFAGFQITVGTSTAAIFDIGTSTVALGGFATSTTLKANITVASGAQVSEYWAPVGGSVRDAILAPNEWVTFKTNTAGLSGYTFTGTCVAEFNVL